MEISNVAWLNQVTCCLLNCALTPRGTPFFRNWSFAFIFIWPKINSWIEPVMNDLSQRINITCIVFAPNTIVCTTGHLRKIVIIVSTVILEHEVWARWELFHICSSESRRVSLGTREATSTPTRTISERFSEISRNYLVYFNVSGCQNVRF